MSRLKHNLIIFLIFAGLFLIALTVFVFIKNLQNSSAGEIAGSLGNILGGAIGALGSAAAVYLMLRGQREDETEKTSAAVLREIAELCKSPMGQLTACAGIQTGDIRVPKAELRRLFHTPTPTIYPAIADRISRLPRPTLVVTFYSQLQETMGLVAVIENSEPRNEIVTGAHIQNIADLLINQCQLARMILSNAQPDPDRETALVAAQRTAILKMLDEELAAARLIFPNAETFQ
jgi:Co/Zn/Cd efflux system component